MSTYEKRKPCRVEEVRLYCDECGCEMIHTGMVHTVNPPRYPHSCSGSDCDNRVNTYERYPYHEFVVEEPDQLESGSLFQIDS